MTTWGLRKSSKRRLAAGIAEAASQFEWLVSKPNAQPPHWRALADQALARARACLVEADIEGGWGALHSALRLSIWGLSTSELADKRISLLNEAVKLAAWRRDSIQQILGSPQESTNQTSLIAAMEIRDESAATQYHKIWMTGEQVSLLLRTLLIASLVYVAILGLGKWCLPTFGADSCQYQKIASAIFLGLLGGSLSALRGLMNLNPNLKIPERVANHFTTMARLVSGALSGLAGYVFWTEGIIPIKSEWVHPQLSIPIAFGFIGESLVMKVSKSMNASRGED